MEEDLEEEGVDLDRESVDPLIANVLAVDILYPTLGEHHVLV